MKKTNRPPPSNDYAVAVAALDRIVREATATATWRPTVIMLMHPDKSKLPDDRSRDLLTAARIMRDAGAMDEEEAFFQIAFAIQGIAQRQSPFDHPKLRRLSDEMSAVERAEGLADDEYWPIGEGPAEWNRIHDQTVADTFRDHGEPEIAILYRDNHNEFFRRYERGRAKIFGPLPNAADKLRDKEIDRLPGAGAMLGKDGRMERRKDGHL